EPGEYRVDIAAGWSIGGGHANGGYVLSVCLQALRNRLDRPDPLVVSAFYQRRVPIGPALIRTEPARAGRRLATGEARLLGSEPDGAAGGELVRVVASFTDLSTASGRTTVLSPAPQLPPPADCQPLYGEQAELPNGIGRRLECRVAELPGWRQGTPSGQALLECWIRFADGHPADTLALPGLTDMVIPAVFDLGEYRTTTIELTAHVRARPAPGWLAFRARTNYLIDGYHEEDVEIWDSTGQLVAQSRQLALLG
ncbi:MAG: thioesterase family protein, partial [Jatrophihabitantaceae bacterium]